MNNIFDILQKNGITVPEENKKQIELEVKENYRTTAEYDKKIKALETERDNFKTQYETASETLKGFDGVDVDKFKTDIETYKNTINELQETHKKELYDRDFSDVLEKELSELKFSSEAAKKAILSDIKSQELKLVDGKIMGLNDYIDTVKSKDASAFVDEAAENNKVTYTTSLNKSNTQTIVGDPDKMSFEDYKKWRQQN